jgi:hypothetical protein
LPLRELERALEPPRLEADEVERAAERVEAEGEVLVAHARRTVLRPRKNEARDLLNRLQLRRPLRLRRALRRGPLQHARRELLVWEEKQQLAERTAYVRAEESAQVEQLAQHGLHGAGGRARERISCWRALSEYQTAAKSSCEATRSST